MAHARVASSPVTVIDRFADLEAELDARGVTLWLAALPPRAVEVARLVPRWREMEAAGQIYPTALATVQRYGSPVGDETAGASDP